MKRVGLDLGMATAGAGRRSSMGFRDRIGKATRRNSNRIKLRLPSVKANVRILQGSVLAGGTWGHQAQGLSPKERKTVRMMAAATGFRQKLGSVDIVLDLGEGGLKDPLAGHGENLPFREVSGLAGAHLESSLWSIVQGMVRSAKIQMFPRWLGCGVDQSHWVFFSIFGWNSIPEM